MSETFNAIIASPLGLLGLRVSDTVDGIEFLSASIDVMGAQTALAAEAVAQMNAYFQKLDYQFDLPLAENQTTFQGRVRQAMQAIPCGETRTYGEVAGNIGSGARAVGNACRHNPLPVVVPCHRIVSATGLGGYAGETAGDMMGRKRWLLQHEGVQLD